MKLFCIILFVGSHICLSAQQKMSGRNYFDSNWKLSSVYDYKYYREAYKYSSGNYLIYDYYKGGKLQCVAHVDYYDFSCGKHPIDCRALNGYVKWFYTNGRVSKKERFKNGRVISIENWSVYGSKTSSQGCISGDCEDGYGTYIWKNGDQYQGSFSNGLRNGRGTYTLADGTVKKGYFNDDKFSNTNYSQANTSYATNYTSSNSSNYKSEPDLSTYIPESKFVNFNSGYTDNRFKRFFRGYGVSALNKTAHPLYKIRGVKIVKGYGYYDVVITYKGRIADFIDTYRLHLRSDKSTISSIEVTNDGNFITPAFTLAEKVKDLLSDEDSPKFVNKVFTKNNVKLLALKALNYKLKKY